MFAHLGFLIRRHLTGRLRLRRGLPAIRPSPGRADEVALYEIFSTLLFTAAERVDVRQVIDVGCRNWSYVAALARAFPAADLVGVEVDGHRRFTDLHRRVDHARAHAAACGRPAHVVHGDFRLQPPPAATSPRPILFTFFFPFLSAEPARGWGLPATFADFGALLAHARRHAAGWLSVHQGEAEADLARRAYAAHAIAVRVAHLPAGDLPAAMRDLYDPWVMAAGLGEASAPGAVREAKI